MKEIFCNKHNLTPDECTEKHITSEDMRYDILSQLPVDVVDQWCEYRDRENSTISLSDWVTKTDNHYCPQNIDNSSMIDFASELESMVEDMERKLNNMYAEFYEPETDDGSDEED